MPANSLHHRTILPTLIASILLLLLAGGTSYVLANQTSATAVPEAGNSSPSGWGDDGIFEVGVEWENVFPDPAANRNYWNVSCDGIYNWLGMAGWTQRYRWVNYDAFEKDFKLASYGGWESNYVDSVDLSMVCTHGSHANDPRYQKTLSAVYFGSTRDDHYLSPGEAYIGLGDKDLEYLAIDSCNILEDASVIYWASTFNGLHLLLGFSNEMHVDPYGDGWVWGLLITMPSYPATLTQGWFTAIDFNQPSDVCARIVGETLSNYNEYWWNTWPDPGVDSEKWIWTHCSHGLVYGQASAAQPEVVAVPVLRVLDRTVNEDYVRNTIGAVFNLTGPVSNANGFYIMGDTSGGITRTLLVDEITGSYSFHNFSELWSTPVITPTLPDARVSATIITDWFNNAAKGLPGNGYRNSGSIYDVEGLHNILLSGNNTTLQGQTTINIPTNVSMTYPRSITIDVKTAAGVQQATYPVFGAGARTVVYLGDGGEIIGAQGGSRNVEVMADSVEILDADVVWGMFLENPNLSIGEIPMLSDTITHTLHTFGYYEMPYYVDQFEFIPVWEFRSDFYLDGDLVAQDYPVYVPAATAYMPPQVEILSPVDGAAFSSGQPISFMGSISGGRSPYTISWSASEDGYLGNTLNLIYPLGSMFRGSASTQVVSLQVIDADGLTSTASITLKINPISLLPVVKR